MLIITLVAAGVSQLEAADSCRNYINIPTPKTDSIPASGAAGAKCDSESLYYGYDRPAQPVKARECAYRELGQHDPGHPFTGEAILAMIYANGKGVPRNLDLALKFACAIDAAPAEMDGRVAHLEKLKAASTTNSDFDICDDITSGYMAGFCAAKQDSFEKAERERKLQAMTARWRPQDQQAFASLRAAARKYFEARSGNEIDLSGTARAAFAIEENAKLENALIEDIGRFERGKLPDQHADAAAADALLNSLYSRLIERAWPGTGTTITADGIRRTERLWIVYRDAWIRFGQAKYTGTTATSWLAWSTQRRIAQLKDLLDLN